MEISADFLVVGSGLAGLAYGLKVADHGHVLILSKASASETNTSWAQGGIAAVTAKEDSFENHVHDTLNAGAGLCNEEVVRQVVEQAPERILDLKAWGVEFDVSGSDDALTREGGHSERRILHVHDETGRAIHTRLLALAKSHPNIEFLEHHMVIDLITNKKVVRYTVEPTSCVGCYALDVKTRSVKTIRARTTVLATGGAGKIYLYTTNWAGASGDGIALAWRAGARVANLEFMQFHPTCLYHPQARNFLISEALRGEGARLLDAHGQTFMPKYHSMGDLAPRDIVARSIDAEMKASGHECMYLDISDKPDDFIRGRFPAIYKRCLEFGIDITKQPIPIVPAAHYTCGGVLIDADGRTDIDGLFAIGETACSGLHGANRLASNSLLECMVFAHQAADVSVKRLRMIPAPTHSIPGWEYFGKEDRDEMVVISHMWDEIRRLMWNYVGIVRSNKRLERAQHRLRNIRSEIKEYYWNFHVHPDILELRNLALVAQLSVTCALRRKESRGIHFNLDYPQKVPGTFSQLTAETGSPSSPMDTILAPSFES